MTIANEVKKFLVDRGMFEDDANAVLERMKTAPENGAMKDRWNDPVSDYPPAIKALALFSAKKHGLEYIDENIPKAWFRPMFDDEQMAKIEANKVDQ